MRATRAIIATIVFCLFSINVFGGGIIGKNKNFLIKDFTGKDFTNVNEKINLRLPVVGFYKKESNIQNLIYEPNSENFLSRVKFTVMLNYNMGIQKFNLLEIDPAMIFKSNYRLKVRINKTISVMTNFSNVGVSGLNESKNYSFGIFIRF